MYESFPTLFPLLLKMEETYFSLLDMNIVLEIFRMIEPVGATFPLIDDFIFRPYGVDNFTYFFNVQRQFLFTKKMDMDIPLFLLKEDFVQKYILSKVLNNLMANSRVNVRGFSEITQRDFNKIDRDLANFKAQIKALSKKHMKYRDYDKFFRFIDYHLDDIVKEGKLIDRGNLYKVYRFWFGEMNYPDEERETSAIVYQEVKRRIVNLQE